MAGNGSTVKWVAIVGGILTIFLTVGGIFMAVGSEKAAVSTNAAGIAENKADIKANSKDIQEQKGEQKVVLAKLEMMQTQMDKIEANQEKQTEAIIEKIGELAK